MTEVAENKFLFVLRVKYLADLAGRKSKSHCVYDESVGEEEEVCVLSGTGAGAAEL